MSKTILITGAGSGFGLGAALKLARRGNAVIATTQIVAQMTAVRAAAESAGVSLRVEKLDVTDSADRRRAEDWGVDVLVIAGEVTQPGDGDLELSASRDRLIWTPAASFPSASRVQVTVDGNLRDLQGNLLEGGDYLFEFGVEAGAEPPSKQDLWVTPVIGSMVGLYFMHLRDNVRERDAERGFRSTGDKWVWVLTDPLGSLNKQFDKWFGWDTEVELRPYRMQLDVEQLGDSKPTGQEEKDYAYGLQLQVRW